MPNGACLAWAKTIKSGALFQGNEAKNLTTIRGVGTKSNFKSHGAMEPIIFPKPTQNLYIVTDSHLDHHEAPYQEFIAMLAQLEHPQGVICLGDLFKAWLALPKFWLPMHQEVMAAFEKLKQAGVAVIFVVGNREVLLPRNWNAHWKTQFPFTHLIRDAVHVHWGERCYGLVHGDTINQNDLNYLRWRKIARSRGIEWLFRFMPVPLAHWLAYRVEAALAASNQEFKIAFPQKEVEDFAKAVLHEVDQYFVGHFHQDYTLQLPDVRGILRVVPDWLAQRAVVQINPQGETKTLYFQNLRFQ